MPPESSDHELLLLMNERQRQMSEQLTDALAQLKRGNERFVQISLREQEFGAGLAGLRQDFSRAMLEIAEVRKKVDVVQDDFDVWKQRLKTIAWIGTPIVLIILALAQEGIRRWLFP
jgi:hypothetical protein